MLSKGGGCCEFLLFCSIQRHEINHCPQRNAVDVCLKLMEGEIYNNASSAQRVIFELPDSSKEIIVSMYMRNSNGPKTESCNTPEITYIQDENFPLQHVDICSDSYTAKLKE